MKIGRANLLTWMLTLTSINAVASPDVFEPKSTPLATVIFLHGGAWQGGDKSQYAKLASTFTAHGIRFVSANYRLSSEAAHPAPIDDLEVLLKNSKWENIYLVGHSAGAHLIAFWNTAHTNARVAGFIGLEGIYDIPQLIKVWPTYKDWFIAKEFGTSDKWTAASPALLPMKSYAPWLVIHSVKDELVDLAQSSEFVKHLESEKISAALVTLPQESHFSAVEALANPLSPAAKAVIGFIKPVAKSSAKPPSKL